MIKTTQRIDQLTKTEVQEVTKKTGSIHNDTFQGVFDEEDKLRRLIAQILKEK